MHRLFCLCVIIAFGIFFIVPLGDCIKCYSCTGKGQNEIDANVRCLESADLERCEKFDDYYYETEEDEDATELYEYYYQDLAELNKRGKGKGRGKGKRGNGRVERSADGLYYYDDEPSSNNTEYEYEEYEEYDEEEEEVLVSKKKTQKKKINYDNTIYGNGMYDEDDDDNDDKENRVRKTTPDPMFTTTEEQRDRTKYQCYSKTIKLGWEKYQVEKGCKAKDHCEELLDTDAEWTRRWNFCCGKMKCNAKIVKDSPLRAFGKLCRQTNDCLQGYLDRPVCKNFFTTCPRASEYHRKMECRPPALTLSNIKKSGSKFASLFNDKSKRCFCTKGYFPKGPVCTSSAKRVSSSSLLHMGCLILFDTLLTSLLYLST
ncbi:unnamed protein product [Owenia fusiformis]|uniref:Uncharacterized protein n=1 Tax=Owenia fusiformis TaxID=6347 RepID=A0A8J1Y0Q7_OWEFU|nr:unnamed protein product [Owenia fusiformis]